MEPATPQQGLFGPQTALIDRVLDRAGRLTETDADAIWAAHLQEIKREELFRASLEAVVDAAHVNRRTTEIKLAETAGREAVTVLAGTAQGDSISGYVGRLAEALVIADLVDAASIEPLTRPWIEVIGPFKPSDLDR